jgi:hypothetical protein
VGSLIPLDGFKLYVGTINTVASSLTVQYWDGSSFVSVSSLVDGTSSAGVSLAQTGSISFTSTASFAKANIIDGTFLYWYKVYVNALDAATSVYYVTLSAEMQQVVDIWDGTLRSILGFYNYNGTSFLDNTSNVFDEDYFSGNTATYADVSSLATANYLVVGFAEQQVGFLVSLVSDSINTTAATTTTVSYWDGAAWVAFSFIDDKTIEGGISFAKSGVVSWNPPTLVEEFKRDIAKDVPLYYYKIQFSQILSADVKIDYIAGIPAQRKISNYSFALHGQDRLWLCSDQAKNKNSLIVGSGGTSCVFNGDNSLAFSFGDDRPLVAGTVLYAQYGSTLYDLIVLCKEHETWMVTGSGPGDWKQFRASQSIGCVAPRTMVTVHVNFEIVQGLNRHVALWQAADGIYVFDGRIPHPIHLDIQDVFDTRNTDGINPSMKSKSVGFFDRENAEYHWLWASGSSTSLNKEYVFDLKNLKWFEVDRWTGKALQVGLHVTDTSGNIYTYGFIDTGYCERLEFGNSFDGTAITASVWFGDMLFGKTALEETTLRLVKLSMASKTSGDVTLTHYGNSNTSGTNVSLSVVNALSRIAEPTQTDNLGPFVTHSFKLSYTSSTELTGFEPIIFSLKYKDYGIESD